jgi:hypothetical protein
MSSLTTPFWNDTTAVFSPSTGLTDSAASCVSHSFTVKSTRSAVPISAGLSVA